MSSSAHAHDHDHDHDHADALPQPQPQPQPQRRKRALASTQQPRSSRSAYMRTLLPAVSIAVLAVGAAQLGSRAEAASVMRVGTQDRALGASGSGLFAHASSSRLELRHGDHGHEDNGEGEEGKEEEEEEDGKQPAPAHEHPHEHSDDHHDMDHTPAAAPPHHHEHGHSHADGDATTMNKDAPGSIPYANFTHEHGPWTPAERLPDPWTAGPLLLPIPPPPPGQWGGHHHHGNAPALTVFNETALFYSKGAAPLSYVEWDMNWGPARTNEVRRFVAAGEAETDGVPLMGAVDGRWRKLFDEWDPVKRVALNKQMKAIVEHQEPARHAGLMAAHVAGCIIACFILLPMTLFLRAASSSLAPLSALAYLATLFFSLFLGGVYKALSPPLFAPNSHGKMGWSLFWISCVVFSLDVIRLVRQIASVFVGPRSVTRWSGRWKSLWSRVSNGGDASASNAIALGEYYSPAEEEERMLHTAHSEEDAEEVVALPKSLDDEEYPVNQAVYQPRPIRRNGSASSSSSSQLAGEGCPSPTGTLVGTPRGSLVNASFAMPWSKSSRSVSPSSPAEIDAETEKISAGIHAGRRQHRRGMSSISTLWERDHSPKTNHAALPADTAPIEHSPAYLSRKQTRQGTLRSILRYTHVTVARSLPILAFAAAYTGLTVYTGSCRANTINGCAAHGIKGGIFFWFGLLTFGRYIGAYADHGWAWNARPKTSKVPSAEFVESLVIFTYGATNTWMERFGAKAGDPYSVKQVQHISIAVMYWFAGLVGMIIETKWTKRLLGLPIALTHPSARPHSDRERAQARVRSGEVDADGYASELMDEQRLPPSYAGSFNPFPALCIGVTGVAMAAHHQDYVYEVEVHALWGNLLAAFAVLRCLTYFFLYLRPPTASILPGRPPTEALASFALACGGLVFMLSSEEVSFLAMRTGWSDIMMITNVTVAVVCLVFCGIAAMFILKAWAVKRELRRSLAGGAQEDTHDEHTGAIALGLSNTHPSPRLGMQARVTTAARAGETDGSAVPVFVVGEDGEEEEVPAGARGGPFTTSPDHLPTEIRAQPGHAQI